MIGPHGSGKNSGKKIGTSVIKTVFNESISVSEIYKSFIDINVDDIVYEVIDQTERVDGIDNNATMEDKLKQNTKNIYTDTSHRSWDDVDAQNKCEFAAANIHTLVHSYTPMYIEKFKHMHIIGPLLRYSALYLNKNVIYETTTLDFEFISNLLSDLVRYHYIPIFIYPFINDVNILYKRTLNRGIDEGRFYKCYDGDYSLVNKMRDTYYKYNSFKRSIDTTYHKYCIFQYNSNFDEAMYEKISRNNEFININGADFANYFMELIYIFDRDYESKQSPNYKRMFSITNDRCNMDPGTICH